MAFRCYLKQGKIHHIQGVHLTCLEVHSIDSLMEQIKETKAYLSNQIKTEVAFDISSKIHWKVLKNSFLINSPSCNPSVLIIPSHALLQTMWQLPVMHPLFCICPPNPPLFQSHCGGLEVRLLKKKTNWSKSF